MSLNHVNINWLVRNEKRAPAQHWLNYRVFSLQHFKFGKEGGHEDPDPLQSESLHKATTPWTLTKGNVSVWIMNLSAVKPTLWIEPILDSDERHELGSRRSYL